ncbi:hypothetical protein QOT17_014106 [Balamuthia mandrillaris]
MSAASGAANNALRGGGGGGRGGVRGGYHHGRHAPQRSASTPARGLKPAAATTATSTIAAATANAETQQKQQQQQPTNTSAFTSTQQPKKATEGSNSTAAASAANSSNKSGGKRRKTKLIVRGLPPALSEEAFRSAVGDAHLQNTDYIFFVPGHSSTKRTVLGYAFMNFTESELLLQFVRSFNGHSFIDGKGKPYVISIEYAPYQRKPKQRKKSDPREGSLEQDEDYLKFIEEVNKEDTKSALPSAEVQLEKRLAEERELLEKHGGQAPPIMSPLLRELLEKKALRAAKRGRTPKRDKRERRRRQKKAAASLDGTATAGDDAGLKKSLASSAPKKRRSRRQPLGRQSRSNILKEEAASDASSTSSPQTQARNPNPQRGLRMNKKRGGVSGSAPSPMWSPAVQKNLQPGAIMIQTRASSTETGK